MLMYILNIGILSRFKIVFVPTIVRTIVSLVTRGDKRFVDLMIILY